MTAFFRADRTVGRTVIIGCPRFYFDDGQAVAVPRDQVGFAGSRSQTVVARDNGEAVAAQEAMRQILAAPGPDSRVSHNAAGRRFVRSLDHLKPPFDRFPAHDDAQVMLPEAPVARKRVDQQLKPEPSP